MTSIVKNKALFFHSLIINNCFNQRHTMCPINALMNTIEVTMNTRSKLRLIK